MLCSCTNILRCVIEHGKLLDGDIGVSNAIPPEKPQVRADPQSSILHVPG
jgi:hypothetical protein